MSGDEPIFILEPIIAFAVFAGVFTLAFFVVKRLPRRIKFVTTICLYAILTLSSVVFGAYVWPTPWRYWATHDFDYRTNRVTGKIEIGTGSGWVPDPNETERDIQRDDAAYYEKDHP